jgi:hypothetical protein
MVHIPSIWMLFCIVNSFISISYADFGGLSRYVVTTLQITWGLFFCTLRSSTFVKEGRKEAPFSIDLYINYVQRRIGCGRMQ